MDEPLNLADRVTVQGHFLSELFKDQVGAVSCVIQTAPGVFEYEVWPFSRDRPGLRFTREQLELIAASHPERDLGQLGYYQCGPGDAVADAVRPSGPQETP